MPPATSTSPPEPAPPPSVLIIGSEAVPFAKTGGLADVYARQGNRAAAEHEAARGRAVERAKARR